MSATFPTTDLARHPGTVLSPAAGTALIALPDTPPQAAPPQPGDPGAEPTALTLSPARLLPRLHLNSRQRRPELSDDGFSDSPALIALSRQLSAGLHCLPAGGGGRGTAGPVTVSQRGLGELDLSPQQAWHLAAENLLHRSREAEGFRFYTRPATALGGWALPALQVATPGSGPTAWLAHPQAFTIMHSHLCRLMGTEVRYLAPTREVLLAFPAEAPELRSCGGFLERHAGELGRPLLGGRAISYECGFPALSDATH